MTAVYQLKISLDRTKPSIWRRFFVEEGMSFHKLHLIIQEVMGWENYHLYDFNINQSRITLPDSDWDDPEKIMDSKKTKVKDLVLKQKFFYTYDFGDCWEHTILVEKILPKEQDKMYPHCVGGELSCPPEDCGSTFGYYRLLEIRADKKHPEYKHLIKEWLGEDYDPNKLDIEDINNRLLKYMKVDGRTRYWVKKK